MMAQARMARLLLLFFLVVPSTARTRGVQKKKIQQGHRELHGERVRGIERGGVGGRNKGFLEFVPMRRRTDTNVPVAPPTGSTETSTSLPTDAATAAPVPPPSTEVPTPPATEVPTEAPVPDPTLAPTEAPTAAAVPDPTPPPTEAPTAASVPDSTPAPIEAPTAAPVLDPTLTPTVVQTGTPTQVTDAPTPSPSALPTLASTVATVSPTAGPPTNTPSVTPPVEPTFVMGRLSKFENGLALSEGLTSRIIAKSLENVEYSSGELSTTPFHRQPSGGDTFVDTRGNNTGGWAYLSSIDYPEGGCALLTFNADGEEGTQSNSNGGRTPWDTWVSGERDIDETQVTPEGVALQVDPFAGRDSEVLPLTEDGGAWAGFTYDLRDPEMPIFFLSENWVFGKVTRYIPDVANKTDPWEILHGTGTVQYLLLQPNDIDPTEGTFSWTDEVMIARANAAQNYPEAQGIDVNGSTLAFVIQGLKQLFLLDLDAGVYKRTSTNTGLLEGEPNEIRYVTGRDDQTFLYMTEANGQRSGVHARTDAGFLYTVFEGSYQPKTAGFALSPNGMHMYVSFPRDGLVFEIVREDGLSFLEPALSYEVAA